MSGIVLPSPPRPTRDARRPAGFTATEFVGALALAFGVFCAGALASLLAVAAVSALVQPQSLAPLDVPSQIAGLAVAWLWFVVVSALVVAVPGWPVALGVAAALRGVRSPAIHLAVHGLAAAAVAVGATFLVFGGAGNPLSVWNGILVIGWPLPAGAVVSTWVAWIAAATRIRRARIRAQLPSTSIDSESTASAGSGRA